MDKYLIDMAAGKAPCDLDLRNCITVDVLGGRSIANAMVSIRNGKIAGVNDGLGH